MSESKEESTVTEQHYQVLEERVKDLCQRIGDLQEAWVQQEFVMQRLEKRIREDHDLLVAKIAQLNRVETIERDVKKLTSYFDNSNGARRMFFWLVSIIGALGAYVVYLKSVWSG